MRVGADVDDLRPHPWKQKIGQRERSEEVGAERGLEPVDGLGALRGDHTGVVDEDVHVAVEQIWKRPHRRLIGEVEFHHRSVAAHLGGALRAQFEIADREDHLRAGPRECRRGAEPHAVGGAGHDDAGSAEVAESAH